MLALKNIIKEYTVADSKVRALNGLSIEFRRNEFVSVLGPSGCGKTTLLNIVGGLDQYTEGNLIIEGKSTKDFSDRDWDTYRNHSIGFVFQSYNLIPHQTVLANVELALTLSGVSTEERKKRAVEALDLVGLSDQIRKKPNQLSGGQMQRVAIARALVNNPQILLADEPTGALDSATSEQIMAILKDVAKDRLVIMVTHNPDLAAEYSTRIVKLKDGQIIDDSNPFEASTFEPLPKKEKSKKNQTHMSFFTALSLSLNNLMTKKARTLLTAFAGSIGIIGIALILSLSNGVQNYIHRVEEGTLSNYPIMIETSSMDINSMLGSIVEKDGDNPSHEPGYIYSNVMMNQLMNTMIKEMNTNNLEAFKAYLESDQVDLKGLINDIQYFYSTEMNIYKGDTSNGIVQVNPDKVMENMGMNSDMLQAGMTFNPLLANGTNVWEMLLDNQELIDNQYEVLDGHMPQNYDEVVLIVDRNCEVSDYTMYALGIKDPSQLSGMMSDVIEGQTVDEKQISLSFEDIKKLDFKLLLNTDYYQEKDGKWLDMHENEEYMQEKIASALTLKIVGIICPAEEAVSQQVNGSIGYTSELMKYLIDQVNGSAIVQAQLRNSDTDIFSGKPFRNNEAAEQTELDITTLTPEQQKYFASLSEEEKNKMLSELASKDISEATYEGNLKLMGVADLSQPSAIYIYPTDFKAKEQIASVITNYNAAHAEEYTIHYTDFVGLIMSSVTTIINAISYILIAFVAISLIVSSIMIGIITYISVLERTKEIGILRSIGASKKDISRVFNAETLIVGLTSGLIGIGVTVLLTIPLNAIIKSITGIGNIALLPPAAGVSLVLISMLLTFISGLIPARFAAKQDPVVALRTE